MTAGVEVEVKLSVTDPAAIRRLVEVPDPARLAGFEGTGVVNRQVVVDRYLDTADRRLEAAGARARLRIAERGEAVLTLKHHGIEAAGVTARHEVEGPATESLVASSWPDSEARKELLALTREAALVEIARLRQRREVRILGRGDARVELSLDALEALDGDRVVAERWELEAELKAGPRAALEDLAAALLELPSTAPATGSKLDFALTAIGAPPVRR